MSDKGSQERSSYLKVAVVFAISCFLAAGAAAIYDAGGISALFGPRLEDFDAMAPPPVEATGESEPTKTVRRPAGRRPPRPQSGRAAGTTAPTPAPDSGAGVAALGNGRLIVRCSQPCRVTVDGAIVGEADPILRLVQPAGDHQVRVEELDGDDLATKSVIVAPNRDREISFKIGDKPPVKDFFKDLKGTEDWAQ